mmetsp:Transcript_30863/g.82734  ORF Transcript_30863/g.82734 Transcript_30863/m.82734 type:complete len:286 (+) Transcript_30863:87-944(+)
MEYLHPNHHQRIGGCSNFGQDISCRVDELAKAMWESTKISPSQYSLVDPKSLADQLENKSVLRPLIIDCREESEFSGGSVLSSYHLPWSRHQQSDIEAIAAEWRRGRTVVFYCIRSQTRAPSAALALIKHLIAHSAGPVPGSAHGVIDRIAVLDGGIIGFLLHLFERLSGRHPASSCGQESELADYIADFQFDMWVASPQDAAAPVPSSLPTEEPLKSARSSTTEVSPPPLPPLQVMHLSEVPEAMETRRLAQYADAETGDELAFLMAQSSSLDGGGSACMSYIS